MALAVVMACNFTLLGSKSIVAAEGWADYYDETWQFEGYDDEYVAFRIPQQSFKNLINSGNYKLVKYDGNDVIVEFHKEDVKEIIEEKPSKLRKFLKAVLWAAYTGIAAITSCGLYRIYNQHIDKMDKDKTTINENSTFFERIDANAANYTKMFNLYVDGTISPNLFGNSSIFNRGINGTKSFFINNLNATQTFLNKIWPFGKKTNSSDINTQQQKNSNDQKKEETNEPESTPIPTQTPKPVETPQPSSSPVPEPTQTPNPPVETPQVSPSPTPNLETETNSSTPIVPPTNSSKTIVRATNSSNTKTQQQPQVSPSPSPAPLSKEQLEELQKKIDFGNCCCLGNVYDEEGKCLQPGGLLSPGRESCRCKEEKIAVIVIPEDRSKKEYVVCRHGYDLVNNKCIKSVNDLNTDSNQPKK